MNVRVEKFPTRPDSLVQGRDRVTVFAGSVKGQNEYVCRINKNVNTDGFSGIKFSIELDFCLRTKCETSHVIKHRHCKFTSVGVTATFLYRTAPDLEGSIVGPTLQQTRTPVQTVVTKMKTGDGRECSTGKRILL